MRWDEFEAACPELAELARSRFERDELVLVGTIRRDGWPRISPCEVDFAAGHLFLGMMWRSPKALDLARDPRVVVHSVTTNKDGTDGDVKLYGHAVDVANAGLRAAFRDAITARIDWAPEEGGYHLFSVDVDRAAYLQFGDGTERISIWDEADGLRRREKAG